MADKAAGRRTRELSDQLPGGPPFDGGFFSTAFRDRVRSFCAAEGSDLPVIFLQLADGRVLDLCHIEGLTRRWMAVAAYRDSGECKEMDTILVPYETIIRVTLSKRKASERRMGFQLDKSALALTETGGGEE